MVSDFSTALDILEAMVSQHCWKPKQDYLDSNYITINADAMRFLAEHGRFDILNDDHGRYVEGNVI